MQTSDRKPFVLSGGQWFTQGMMLSTLTKTGAWWYAECWPKFYYHKYFLLYVWIIMLLNSALNNNIIPFIISILKSLVIPTVWLGLSSVIYSRNTSTFALNHICSKIASFVGSKSHHSCFKSQHFFSTSLHFWVVKAFSCLIPFSTNCLLDQWISTD